METGTEADKTKTALIAAEWGDSEARLHLSLLS